MAGSSRLRVVVTWALLVEASGMEGLAVVAGRPIRTHNLGAEAGAVVALLTRTRLGAGRRRHGVPRKRLTRTPREVERRSIRVPKLQIRTRRKVGGHQPGGAHRLAHRIPILLLPRAVARVAPDQDGAAQHPLGEGRRRNQRLGTRVRPRLRITGGPVQDHRHPVVGGASRAG
jgi:hypothetical protein